MLELKNISKDYFVDKKPFRALKNITLSFGDNGFVSILGPSGCGKTTLLNVIGGLDHYTEGDLIIDGISTKEYKDKEWDIYRNKKIGFVFQSYNLIQHLTILENVELPLTLAGESKKERSEKAKIALEKVGLKDIWNKKPNQLSGGQQQRVAIARSLINDPSIILADEPTGALDSKTSVQVMDILNEISKEKLVIMVTHNADLAKEYSTRIITLKDGELLSDSNNELSKNKEESEENLKKNKTSMSFFSAFKMSLRNLMTKKGRTIATSVASSFGIIGVALVLALSNGFSGYITDLESQTVSTLPINVASVIQQSEKTDTNSLNPEYPDDNLLRPEIPKYTGKYTYKVSNLNSKFLNYIEYLKQDKKYVSTYFKVYNTNYSMNLITEFNNEIKIVDNSATNSSSTDSIMSSYIGLPTTPFHRLYGEEEYIEKTYEVIYGTYPNSENINEVCLVVDEKNQIPFSTLQKLGIFSEYEDKETANQNPIKFEDILNKKYKLVFNDALYSKNNGSNKSYYSQNDLKTLFNENNEKNSIELKITGILRPKQSSQIQVMTPGLCYNSKLSDYIDNLNVNSDVTKSVSKNLEIKDELYLDIFKETLVNLVKDNVIGSENVAKTIAIYSTYMNFYSLFNDSATTANKYYSEMAKIGADIGVNSTSIEYYSEDITSKVEKIFDLYNTDKDKFYEEIINLFAYLTSYSKIRSVVIFPSGLNEKSKILESLDEYNNLNSSLDSSKHAIKESEKVYYIDIVSDLTSSLSILINTISAILIIFASISLIVSSVMTAIITYVSVVERTKEIGILRALGSRKKDVGRLFKAECFIIGLLSGIFGIVVTYIVCIPINLVLNNMFPTYGLGSIASLNYLHALVLILVAIILSYFSGLVPARIAAKKDPVTALRTE